jgi:peptide-O-fucosyltransferase
VAMNTLIFLSVLSFVFQLVLSHYCDIKEIFVIKKDVCSEEEVGEWAMKEDESVYILYSVNPVEGFNLRRDVYLRMAIFIKQLRNYPGYRNAQLVLPSFHHLYHWKSQFRQSNIFWNHFFDLPSLKQYTTVLDIWEFFDMIRFETENDQVEINEVYKLQHFESMFENGVFVDKFEEAACPRNEYDNYHYMENYYNITEQSITCINFQGSVMLLKDILDEYKDKFKKKGPRIVLFAHAETALHDFFGDAEYWMARRSMRFNKNLRAIGDAYRADFLGSTDEKDKVQRPEKWMDEKVRKILFLK